MNDDHQPNNEDDSNRNSEECVGDATATDIHETTIQAHAEEDAVARKIAGMTAQEAPPGNVESQLPLVPAASVDAIQTQIEDDNALGEEGSIGGRKLVGKKVKTMFGSGVVADYRSKDCMYVVQLSSDANSKQSVRSTTTLYTTQTPEILGQTPGELAQQLNVAYEALENMRRLNLDVQCHEIGIPSHEINYDMCTACLLANGGSTKSHFPRLQRWMDSANSATTEFDDKMQSFFQSASSSMSLTGSNPQDPFSGFQRLFNSTTSSASSMASRTSASLQAASNLKGSSRVPENPKVNAAVSTKDESQSASPETTATSSQKVATVAGMGGSVKEGTTSAATSSKVNTADGNSDETDDPSPEQLLDTNRMSAEAAAAFSANPPPSEKTERSSNRFPRIKKLWGTIQSLPPPTVASTNILSGVTNGGRLAGESTSTSISNSSSTLTGAETRDTSAASDIGSSASSATSFPRIRGLLNSSVTTSIFGDNQVKEQGSIADPNILMSGTSNSQRSNRSIDTRSTPKPKREKPIALPRIQKLINQRNQANTSPCLICASPSCPSHSSPSFRKEGITLCLQCERLFELEFIIDCVSSSDATQRSELVDYMIDCYDRCMLLLKYSKQFAQQIAASLEDQKEKQDKIGLASSSVGVLSGVLGIAAAASILTPAGPPLLIASLFFGGGATTVQTGTEAINYFSEPRKLADRIIALHGMSLSILRVTSTLRDAMLRDHIRTDVYEAEASPADIKNQVKESIEKNKNAVVMGSNFGRSLTLSAGLAGAEAGAVGAVAAGEVAAVSAAGASAASAAGATVATGASTAGAAGARGATAFSRAGTAAARTVRFARFAGGALSAAVLVMEANAIQSTVKSIKEGSPCDKADRLRNVMEEIEEFPSTSDLDDECQAYLKVLANRPITPTEVSALPDEGALAAVDDIPEADCQHIDRITPDNQLCAPGAIIVDGSVTDNTNEVDQPPAAAAVPVTTSSSFLGGSSLFQRLQSRREERQSRREERQSLASSAADEVVAVAVDDSQLGASNFSLVL